MSPLRALRRPLTLALLALPALCAATGAWGSGATTETTQVRVRARILEWTHDTTLDWGFRVNYLAEAGETFVRAAGLNLPRQYLAVPHEFQMLFTGSSSGGDARINALIEVLEEVGDVKVLCEPNIVVTLPGDGKPSNEAKVSTKSRRPYESVTAAGATLVEVTKFKDIATQLTVQVLGILKDDFVKMKLNTSVMDYVEDVTVGRNTTGEPLKVPRVDTRKIENTVLVGDRQMFVVGVQKTTIELEISQGVPWLARIPVLGFFFSNKRIQTKDQELLFVVQPEIIRN